ncbi:10675_t:CDS:2 [Acaulospora morrowiae]|uniref:Pre-rRNA-processing protein PNO1 n=1 Tax=Acaulospora morrowiae TaxID=94023 RepID=A0A9N8ZZS4_9GLOM|nr:10675_t:CDS:2 [Acaulospora morrowiae]
MSNNELADQTKEEKGAEDMLVDSDYSGAADSKKPKFRPATGFELNNGPSQIRKILVPRNRFTPLKKEWKKIYEPLVNHLNLQVRMNTKSNRVELKTSKYTSDSSSLQKAADFVHAFMLGFNVDDAIAMLRVDDLYIDSFDIKDVKVLEGDHLSRAIGRIAGKNGAVKFAIENASKTRIVLADTSIHILGSFQNIKIAKDAIGSLILGSPPGKVYANLKIISSRMKQRF